MKDLPFPEKKIVPFVDAYLSHMLQQKEDYSYAIAENFIRCFIDKKLGFSWIDYHDAYRYQTYDTFRGFDLSSDAVKFSSGTMSDSTFPAEISNNNYIV